MTLSVQPLRFRRDPGSPRRAQGRSSSPSVRQVPARGGGGGNRRAARRCVQAGRPASRLYLEIRTRRIFLGGGESAGGWAEERARLTAAPSGGRAGLRESPLARSLPAAGPALPSAKRGQRGAGWARVSPSLFCTPFALRSQALPKELKFKLLGPLAQDGAQMEPRGTLGTETKLLPRLLLRQPTPAPPLRRGALTSRLPGPPPFAKDENFCVCIPRTEAEGEGRGVASLQGKALLPERHFNRLECSTRSASPLLFGAGALVSPSSAGYWQMMM